MVIMIKNNETSHLKKENVKTIAIGYVENRKTDKLFHVSEIANDSVNK